MRCPIAWSLAVCAALGGCDDGSSPRVFEARSRSDLVGGPGAIGELRDWVIENDELRLVISAVGNSAGPGMFGGSIVDADLARPSLEFQNGRGLDQFSELFPMTNLVVPGFFDGVARGQNIGLDDLVITVVNDGKNGETAILRVQAKGDAIIEALRAIGIVGVTTDLSFQTDLILEPGKRYVRMRTRVNVDSKRRPRDEDDPQNDTPMEPIAGTEPLFDVLLGDALGSPEELLRLPGYLGGDFLLFGPKVHVFAPGDGYEVGLLFQRRFDQGVDVLNEPYTTPYLAATGDRVSYAYFSADGLLSVPIFTSSFTGAFSHRYQCDLDDEACLSGYEQGRLVYERFLALGDGDVASALESFYEITDEPNGRVHGTVLDGKTGRPATRAVVMVLASAGEPVGTALEAIEANRRALGNAGVVLQMQADAAATSQPLGAFSGRLPPGDYFLVARAEGHALSAPLAFSIASGQELELSIALPAPGVLDVRVTDEAGSPSPGKLTLVGPGVCSEAQGAPAARSASQAVPLGDEELPDGIGAIVYLGSGSNEIEVQPGEYEAIVSRGLEYSIHRECITVEPRRTVIIRATVVHEVDTTGWISGDFHVHGVRSFDANVSHVARVNAAVGEGLELLSTTDHDVVVDLGPTVAAMGLEQYLATMIGLETTTIETGHYIGFPLRFDDSAPENGAVEWSRRDQCVASPDSRGCLYGEDEIVLPLVPDEIFGALRAMGSLGPERTVVLVPHPRDGFFGYFDQFGLDPFDLGSRPGGLAGFNPVLEPGYFSGTFDSLELFNGKRFEMIRTPTIAEIVEFNGRLEALRDAQAPPSEVAALHEELARRVLERSTAENAIARLSEPQREPGGACDEHRDCRVDEKCDLGSGECKSLECTSAEAEDPELSDKPCLHHQGVVDDWFRMLNAGLRYTGLGNSDTHKLHDIEIGLPRNWIASPTDRPGEVAGGNVVEAIQSGQVTTSYGPFVEMWVDGSPIGATVGGARAGAAVSVRVRVQTPSWFGVDRLEVYRNGELWRQVEGDGDPSEIADFDETFEDAPDRDVWYVAVVLGRQGGLGPVYTSMPHPNLGFSQVAAVAFEGIDSPLIRAIVPHLPSAPEVTAIVPYGVTNPIWLDVAADGFVAPLPTPDWASGSRNELPLSTERLQNPFVQPVLLEEEIRSRRQTLLRRALERAMQMGR